MASMNSFLRRINHSCHVILCLAVFAIAFCANVAIGAPYGPDGKEALYRHSDGATVNVRVFGDEYYAVTETEEGYTVVYDKQNVLRYGRLLPNGKTIVPTGIRADNNPDHNKLQKLGIEKHVRLTPEGIKDAVNRGLQRMRSDNKGRITPESVEYYKKAIKEAKEKAASDPTLAASYAGGDGDDPLVPPPPSFAPPSSPKTGGFVGLCILVDFSDQVGTIPQSAVDDYCNKPGYNGYLNKGSIYDYFYSQSNGKLRYNNIVTAYVRVPNPKTFYDDGVDGVWGDSRAQDLVSDALDVLMAQGFDFTQLSRDGAGVIDAINLFYAGTVASGWSTGLWPHRWAIPTKTVDVANGIKAYDYQMTDMGTALDIGTFCHENGHMLLGYADYYDYKTDGIASLGMSSTTLMASYGSDKNPHNIHAYLKMHSGWLNMTDLRGTSTPRRYALRVDSDLGYKFSNPSLSTEYFIFENRAKVGWEANGTLADQGMMITHNHEGGNRDAQNMTEALHYECSVEQADNLFEYEKNTGATDSTDFFHSGGTGPNSSFDDTTSPNAKWWAGAVSGNGDDGTASGLVIHSIGSAGEFISFIYGTGTPSAIRIIGLTDNIFNPRCDYGQNADSQAFGVYNQNGGTLDYTISDNAAWLSVDITAGTASTEVDKITISFSTSGLSAGSYTATITVTDTGASPTTATITVNLTVNPQPTISFTVPSISGNGDAGLAGPQESFGLLNIGGGEMTYTLSSTQSWLSLSPASGTVLGETDTIYADFDATSLASGTYYDTITITSPEASNSPQTLPVTFNVQSTDMIVSAPDGGEEWEWGQTNAITWASSLGGTVKIELLKGGAFASTIIPDTANDGSYDWVIPDGTEKGTDYTIRLTCNESLTKVDVSNGDFSIANPPIYFTDCEGAEPTGFTRGGSWEWGTPGGNNAASTAYSGTSMFDTDLDNTCWGSHTLTSVAIDCSNYTAVQLQFAAHVLLRYDTGTYPGSYTYRVEVSNTGSDWGNTSGKSKIIYDSGLGMNAPWTLYDYDISDIADGQANVYIRWSQIDNNGGNYQTTGGGVAVDDIKLTGTYSPAGPEIVISRSGTPILDGGTDSVSSTESGVGKVLTYTIANQGGTDLTLTTPVTATPVANCSIAVNTQPTSPVASSGSTQLILTVTPTGTGAWSATVSIANNDSDENPYNWTISGTAVTMYDLIVTSGSGDGRYGSGEVANIVADAPATGYHFVNWTASGGGSFADANAASTTYTMPANNATVTANYALDTYPVTYHANNASSGTPPSDQTKTYGVNLMLSANTGTLARTGYTFSGWNTAADGSGTTYAESATYAVNAGVTLYAKWTANTYTVTFDKQGGSGGSDSVMATYGSGMPASTAPTRAGYVFTGYFAATNGGGNSYYTATMASARNWDLPADTTLYANWSDTLGWDANGTTAGQTDGLGAWSDAGKWWTGVENTSWTPGANASFGNGGAGAAVTLSAPTAVNAFTFNPFTGTYTLGTSGQSITLNNGIIKNASSGAVTFASPITLGAAQTWVNNSSGLITAPTGANLTDNAGYELVLDGDGAFALGLANSTAIAVTGSGNLVKNGNGLLQIGGTNANFTGNVTVNGGVVRVSKPTSINGNLNLNGGVYEHYWSDAYTRTLGVGPLQIRITGGASGFSLNGNTGMTVTLNNSAAFELVWGDPLFNPAIFVLQADTAQSGSSLTLANKINLNGTNRTIQVSGGTTGAARATISGQIRNSTGTAGITKTGAGMLILSSTANAWNGTTSVQGGILDLGGMTSANIAGGTGRTITVGAGCGIRFNALSNTYLNRLVETSDEIGVMSGGTANSLDFSSSTGANLPNAFLGNWAGNGAKAEFSGTITPASDAYRLGAKGGSGALGIVGVNKLTGARGLIVGQTGCAGQRIVIAGANNFTGDTVINTGAKLTLGNNLALQNSALDVGAAGGNFALNSAGTITGVALANNPMLGGLKGSRALLTVFTNAGGNNESNLSSGSVLGFTLNLSEGKVCDYAGTIANFTNGTTIAKTGLGTQILSGANTYTGTTSVDAGKLYINGSLSNVDAALTVAAGATLGGKGTIGRNVTIADGGKLEFDLSTTVASHDGLEISTGRSFAFAGGAVLNITTSGGAEVGTYTLIAGGNNMTGIAPATVNLPDGWAGNVSISGNSLLLEITSISGANYSMTYNGNGSTGGDVPVDGNSPYASGATVTVLGNTGSLVKTGYTFAGWNTQADGNGTSYAPTATFTVNANTVLYAQWTPIDYTVTFQPGAHGSLAGGTPNVVHIVAYGSAAPTPPAVTPDAEYDFTGWDPPVPGTITGDFTTTAEYVLKTYALTVNSGSGDGSYPAGTVVDVAADAPAAGYVFDAWTGDTAYLANAGSASTTFTMPSANASITATYRLLTYTVSYNANEADSGLAPDDQLKTYGVDLTLAFNTNGLAKTGHTFSGWNTQADGNGTSYAEGATYTGNAALVLYAKWTLNQYTVAFQTDGTVGASLTGNTNQVVNHGANGTAVTANVPSGYQFVNWTVTDVPYSTEATVTPSNVIENMTLVANFVANDALVITAASAEKVYDGTALTTNGYSIASGTLDAEHTLVSVTVTGSQTLAGASPNVPSNALIRDGSSNDVTHLYNLTFINGALTVTQRPLTITAASDSKVYDGTALTTNGYSVTSGSPAAGDTLDSVTVTGSQTDVGSSDNVPSAASITNSSAEVVTASYDITYANGTLSVTAKDATTLTIAVMAPVTYDGTAQMPAPVVNDGATVLTNATDYTLSYAANTNAGTATVTVLGVGNYTGTQDKQFTISPATLIVTPDSGQSKVLGAADPVLTYTNTGAVAGETAAFAGALTRDVGENVGTYAITQVSLALADNAPFLAANYTLSFTAGVTFAITGKDAADLTIADIAPFTYDGTARTPEPEVKDGEIVLVQDTDYTLSYAVNTNAGTATVTVTGIGNYSGTQDKPFTISPATLTVTPDSGQFKVYGADDPVLTYLASGAISGETPGFSGALSRATGEAVGTYAITVGTLALADNTPFLEANYTVSFTAGVNFTITKATPTVTEWPTASPIALGQALSASTLSNGTASVEGSFAFTTPETVPPAGGTYAASVTFTPTDTVNYTTVAGSVDVWVDASVVLPFAEDFEGLTLGDLNGQNSWLASGSVVQTNVVYEGSQAAEIAGDGYVQREFVDAQTNVWTDFRLQPAFLDGEPGNLDADSTTVLYFNTNGHPVVYDGLTAVVVSNVTVSTGEWVRVSVHSDYVAKKWSLYVNTLLAMADLEFYDTNATHYTQFSVKGGGNTGAAVDSVAMDTESPFAGLPRLTVYSAHGTPYPAVGTASYAMDSEVNAYMADSVITNGSIRYVCTGWMGSGSGLGSGADTNFIFTIIEDTTLTWQWQTNYWVELNTAGE